MSTDNDFDDYWLLQSAAPEKLPEPNLTVTTIDGIEPLDDQFGVVAGKNVPDALYEPLFGQVEFTKSALTAMNRDPDRTLPVQTYAILDAAKVTNLPELLESSGLAYRCLFKGDAYDDLKNVAPWIVKLEEGNAFTRNLFVRSDAPWHLWDQNVGMYLRSRGTLDDIWGHFRKLTRVQDEQGKWFYFRFWDWLDQTVLREFDGPKSTRYYTDDARYVRHHSLENQTMIACLMWSPDDTIISRQRNTGYVISLPRLFKPDETRAVTLTQTWKRAHGIVHQGKYVRGVLANSFPDVARSLRPDLQLAFAEHIARIFVKYNLQKGYSKETYVLAAVLLGTRFDDDFTLPQAREILDRDEPCYLRMVALRTAIFENKDKIYGAQFQYYAKALDRVARQDEAQLIALSQRSDAFERVLSVFPEKARSLNGDQYTALAQLSISTATHHMPEQDQRFGAVVLFAHGLVLGSGCFDDPLHDYIRQLLRSDKANKASKLLRYGQRRAKAQLRKITKLQNSEAA